MKLHLPKTLLTAVLACFTIGNSYGLSISSRATWSVSDILTAIGEAADGSAVTKTWNGTTYTFTSSGGMLDVSGYALSSNSLSNITFEAKKTELQALADGTIVSLILIDFAGVENENGQLEGKHKWGVNVKGTAGDASSLFTGQADNGNDWTGTNAGRTNVSGMADDGIVSAYFNKNAAPGVSLANGYESKTTQADCIYYADGLRWSGSTGDLSLKFNTTYVTSLIQQANRYESSADSYKVGNADGTWHKDYTSMATTVSNTSVGATLVTGGRLEITSSNAQLLSTNGGEIIIGGRGQLFLQGHGSNAAIELNNNIYLGGSTHDEAATYGALRFGSDGDYTITLNGNITLVENGTMGSNTGENLKDVFINGNVSGNYKLSIVKGAGIDFAGGISLGSLELASGVSIDIKSQAATVGTFGTTGTGAQVTVTGTTLTINGLYAGYSNVLTTGADGAIVFGQNATIDVSKLTATGNSDRTVDGFIQESYRVTASDVNASISGETIALVRGDESLGNATWSSGEVTMGEAIYNVATTKSYADYCTEAENAGKTAISIEVQENGTFKATNAKQTITIVGLGGSTLAANWTGRAQAGDNISTAATTFHGDVVVESGASWLISNGYDFSSVTVESGGQFGLDGTYTGNITISGTGVSDSTDADQKNGALKFGDGGTLVGNVTISGSKAALSTWGTHAGTIKGNINCATEGGAELVILNGDTAHDHTADNTIRVGGTVEGNQVGGNLSGINKVTTTAASMTVTGTIRNFGDTFTKSGAGTLTLSKAGAITGGKVVVDGGTLELTGEGQAGTLSGVNVEVKKGATIKVGHDCAGWSGGISSISLTGEESNVATMTNNDDTANGNTWNTSLNLNGYATVKGGKLMSFGGSLSAEGTENTFGSTLLIAQNFTVTVEEGGELEISGQIANSAHPQKVDTAKLIKAGAGELKLTHVNNTFTCGGIALNAGTLTIENDSATTTAAGISGTGKLATSGGGTKTFSAAVTAGNITISGGATDFDNTVTTGALTVGAATTMSALNLSGAATLNANLTVEGSTTLSGASTTITLADSTIFTTGNEKIAKLNTGTDTTISGTGIVSVGTAGITYTNALIDVTATNNISTIAAKLSGSKVVNNNTDESSQGVEVSADSLTDGTNDVAAEAGNITITGVGADGVTVQNLTVESGKEVSATAGGGSSTTPTINVTGTASLANGSTVSGNVSIANSGTLVIGGTDFSENGLGATVEGTLTANATAVSMAEESKIDVTNVTTTTTYVLATAQDMRFTGNFDAANFYTGTLAAGMTAAVTVQSMQTGTYAINPATASQLVLTLTEGPVTLTATAVDTTYTAATRTLNINVEGYDMNALIPFAGRDLAVTVGSEAWASIVDAMSGVEGGVYNTVTITLDGLTLDSFGTVSFNGYTGIDPVNSPGKYFVAYIPEPTTATLSLLALAALAARRRRRF